MRQLKLVMPSNWSSTALHVRQPHRERLVKCWLHCSLPPTGTGSQLLVYPLPGGRLLHSATVLPNAARVHGIATAPLEGGLLAIAVHGDHYVKARCFTKRRARRLQPTTAACSACIAACHCQLS
jgi:hypothetical protein